MTNEQKSMRATFLSLRMGVGVLGILFPLILWGGGKIAGFPLRESMSAYYHASFACPVPAAPSKSESCPPGGGTMRNAFVGILFAVGAAMYFYKGFSIWENFALNLAGISAICVAIFPMPWTAEKPQWLSMHFFSAMMFFVCIAFVCTFCSEKTLQFASFPGGAATRRNFYRSLYGALALIINRWTNQRSKTFWIETFGIVAFGVFWLVKTVELSSSGLETDSLQGKVDIDRRSLLGHTRKAHHLTAMARG